MVEVILKQEILKLGSKGDIVRVANGFARNHLFPKQLAIPATKASRKQVDQMKASAEREAARLMGDAEKLASVLENVQIKIVARAGEADQLFGSVTSRDIATELEKQGYSVDRHHILISKPIRMVGEHDVKLHLHRDIDVPIKVNVLAEGREEESASPAEESASPDDTSEAAAEESASQDDTSEAAAEKSQEPEEAAEDPQKD